MVGDDHFASALIINPKADPKSTSSNSLCEAVGLIYSLFINLATTSPVPIYLIRALGSFDTSIGLNFQQMPTYIHPAIKEAIALPYDTHTHPSCD